MVAYSAGIGALQAAAIVMSNFSVRFGGLGNSPLAVFYQGGFVVLIAVILILPVIIYAIKGTTARPQKKLSIKRRIICVTCGLILAIGVAVGVTILTDETVFIGAIIPISYVADDLLEGVTVCPMGLSQLKMSGMSLPKAVLCLGVMQAVGNVDRLVSLVLNTVRNTKQIDVNQCLQAIGNQRMTKLRCSFEYNSTTSTFIAVQNGSTSLNDTFALNGTVPMVITVEKDFLQILHSQPCNSNCVGLVMANGQTYWLESKLFPAAYAWCKTGYGGSVQSEIFLFSGVVMDCPATKANIPTCQDLGASSLETSTELPSSSEQLACLVDGIAYTAPGVMASVSNPGLDTDCRRGYKVDKYNYDYSASDAYENRPSKLTVYITKGATAPLCTQSESEDIWGVVGITAAKVLCTYLFVFVVYVAVRRDNQWAKLLSGGMFDSDALAPQEGQSPDKTESAVTAVTATTVFIRVPADDKA